MIQIPITYTVPLLLTDPLGTLDPLSDDRFLWGVVGVSGVGDPTRPLKN